MDEREVLALIYDEHRQALIDKTANINKISPSLYKNCVDISYYGSNRKYTTKNSNCRIYRRARIINIANKDVYYAGRLLRGLNELIDFGPYLKGLYNESSELFSKDSIKIIAKRDIRANELIKYISELTEVIRPNVDSDDGVRRALENGIDSLAELKENSFLYHMLYEKIEYKEAKKSGLIYPFMANCSQRLAVGIAINNRASIIEGPPGTGKTQTILNIIANLIIRNKTIAIVSGKNEALANIYDKLKGYGYDYIAANLGSRENRDEFFSREEIRASTIAAMLQGYKISSADEDKIRKYEALEALDQRLSRLTGELNEVRVEYNSYIAASKIENTNAPKGLLRGFRGNYLALISLIKEMNKRSFGRLLFIIRAKCYISKNSYNMLLELIPYFEKLYYLDKIKALELEINELKERLRLSDYNGLRAEINTLYNNSFKHSLYKHYSTLSDMSFTSYSASRAGMDYLRCFDSFIKRYPVITSTTFSLIKCKPKEYLFDYLIMDESSQSDIASAIIAFSMAKAVIVIGDSKQLDKIVPANQVPALDSIFNKYRLEEYYSYTKNNALSMLRGRINDSRHITLINEHFRCDSYIIGFCNKRFYNNELIIRTKHEPNSYVKVIKTAAHQEREHSSLRQVEEIALLLSKIYSPKLSIGIITPFRNQVELLENKLLGKYPNLKIGTIHKFQGRENDIIIISTVENDIKASDDFLEKPDLINVAISRAKKSLYLLVSEGVYNSKNTILRDFIDYERLINNNLIIEKGQINSVFDLMYEDYNGAMLEYKRSLRVISDFASENIIGGILADILANDKYSHIGYLHNYELIHLIGRGLYSYFNERELEFIKTGLSHIDFLIYNRVSKRAMLAIEVDGYQHTSDSKQVERDMVKDSILSKIGLPLIRYKTNASLTVANIKADLEKYIG